MKKGILGAAIWVCVLAGLASCVSAGKPRGPVDSFAFVAGANKALAANAVGTINPGTDPQEIRVTVPPGTDLHALVATLSLNTEAVITVISSGARVVQQNGVTPNDFSVPVTYAVEVPKDKKPWNYKVFVREAETNAQLGMLAVPPGAVLSPQFSPAVHAYTVEVPYAVTSIQIRAGGQSRTLRSITADGAIMPGGTATVSFESVQEKTITIESIAEDGVTKAQYTVTIRRAPPDANSSLDALDLGQIPLLPAFSADQMGYQATVAFAARQLLVHAHPQSPVAAVTLISGAAGTAGDTMAFHGNATDTAGATVDLPADQNFSIVVQVTAQDGSIQQYLLSVNRAPPDHNAALASLGVSAGTLAPVFSPRIPQYTLALPSTVETVVLTPVAASPVATVTIAGQPGTALSAQGVTVPVAPGASAIVVFAVRAEDGFQRQYRVQVNRAQDANAFLQSLQLGGATIEPAFTPTVILYDLKVPADAQSFSIVPAAQSRYASVVVDGRPITSAPLSLAVPPAGQRIVVIDVTAQNGTMVRYTLRVTREAPAPAAQQQPAAQAPTAQQPAAAAQQPSAGPALTMPPDTGKDHVVVQASGLKLQARETAALAAAGDQPGSAAIITVRSYRTQTIITRYPGRVEPAAQGKEMVIALDARSNGVSLARDRLVEVETAIPTKAGKVLFYTEAHVVSDEVTITVPFLLYGDKPAVAWPAPGSATLVGAVVSNLPPGKERAMDKEDFPRNARGAIAMTVQLLDPGSGKAYGSAAVSGTTGPQRDRLLAFDKPIGVPEGATVNYVLSATAKNGKTWTATGTAQVWTTELAYPSGFQPAVLSVSDDLAPAGGSGGK